MRIEIDYTNLDKFMEYYDDSFAENNFNNLKFQNVTKKFKTTLALKNISLELKKGDVFGYIGPNGAGKTTTIKIIVGLIKDYSGDYFINGKRFMGNVENLTKILGYHPQDTGFQSWRTINHALYTFGRLSGIDKEILKRRIQSILNFVGLNEFKNRKIKHLSSGMIQKLRLAQALLNLPKILILDEPLSGLDPASRFQVKSLIKLLAQKEITILFSSHILNDVEDIANKIGILNQGHIMKIGTVKQLQEQFQVGKIIEILYRENSKLGYGLESIQGIERIEEKNPLKQLLYLHPNADLDVTSQKVLTTILKQKCILQSFRFLRPSLEKVYLKYIEGEFK